ncbi:hypothetical protein [Kitasatospora sp. NBC_00315]|uniref:hypothetical protein n=1 Tax=Kitasatospora sp. NBC_00315 TaxID=2975963 RepID=UPI003249D3B8
MFVPAAVAYSNCSGSCPVLPGGSVARTTEGRAVRVHGSFRAYPEGVRRPTTSHVNYRAGQTVPNLVIVPLLDRGTRLVFRAVRSGSHG